MRRKSERTSSRKSKNSPEKKIEKEKVKRTRTRRKKQSTSSDNESPDEAGPVQEEVVIDSDKKPPSTPVKEDSPEDAQDQVWRVKAPESADSGEIQKLKICLTRPPSTPERAERSPRSKRKHSRATSSSDAASGDAADEKKKSKHRSKRAHRDSKDESDRNQDSHDEDQETENEAQQSKEAEENENEVTQSDKDKAPTESATSTTNKETSNIESGESSQTSEGNTSTVTETECKSDADTTVASPKPETTETSPIDSAISVDNENNVTDKQDNLVKKDDSSVDTSNTEVKPDNSGEKQDTTEQQNNSSEKHDNTTEEQGISNKEDLNSSVEKCDNSTEKQDPSTSVQDISMHDRSESHDDSEIIELHPDDSKIETSDVEMSKPMERDNTEETKSNEDPQVKVSISRETALSNDEGAKKDEKTKDNNESGVVENENDDRELRKPSADSEHDKDTEKSEVHQQPSEIERQNTDTGNEDATPSVREDISQNGQAAPIVVNRKRRWGTRPTKLTTQKSITISTDVLKEIIPDVKPVEFDEVIEEKKHRRIEVTEKIERPVLPKIIIDNTENIDQNRKDFGADEKEKENIKSRESHLASNRKISIIKDNDNILARPPSPPKHKQSAILYITNLVRPFTLPQLKNLLQRTGKIMENGFWIDRIKSKCFVQYETEDQAVETRHALHGVKWPVSNPKTLQVDFSSQDAFDKAKLNEDADNAQASTIPGTVEDWLREQDHKRERGEIVNDKPWERKAAMREWDVGKNEKDKEREKLRREERPLEKRRHRSQERSPEPARKFKKKEEEAPAKLLDDLFRKTKTTPCIYWLPLSAETIAVKEEQRRQHMAEYERRLQEQRRPHRRH